MADLRPTGRFSHTTAIGGTGGRPFTCESPGQLAKQVDVSWEPDRLRGIKITLTGGAHYTFGSMEGSQSGIFAFDLGERIDDLTLWNSDAHGGRSGGFRFRTNKGRIFPGGPAVGSPAVLSGGYLAGVFGRCGLDIDQLGFSFANDVSAYYLKDVLYDTVKADTAGVVPTNLDTGVLINSTHAPQKMTYTKNISTTETKSWSSQFSIKGSVKVGGEAGVPFVAKGKVEVGLELGWSYTSGGSESSTSSQTIQAGPIDVQPGKMYRVVSTAESGKLSVPYRGTAVLTYEDGTSVEEPEEGVFEGITVGQVQVQILGPYDVDPSLGGLAPGQHSVGLKDPKYPNLAAQTVLVI